MDTRRAFSFFGDYGYDATKSRVWDDKLLHEADHPSIHRLEQDNPYTGSLEGTIEASNKERAYGLVCPNYYSHELSTDASEANLKVWRWIQSFLSSKVYIVNNISTIENWLIGVFFNNDPVHVTYIIST